MPNSSLQITIPQQGTTIILADGEFPTKPETLTYLTNASTIVCCDGAIRHLEKLDITPTVIVGDLDTITPDEKNKYRKILHQVENQNTNDLTKAMQWCLDHQIEEVVVIGATGKREDHTLGNIGLLLEHCHKIKWAFISNYGWFIPLKTSARIKAYEGQQISIFNFSGNHPITSDGLRYPLKDRVLTRPWEGTLNEAIGDSFSLYFNQGEVVVFLNH